MFFKEIRIFRNFRFYEILIFSGASFEGAGEGCHAVLVSFPT